MTEEWKTISICPEYEVSSAGRVRKNGNFILKARKDSEGELFVMLDYKRKFYLKLLVWAHFIGIRPKGHMIKLKDPKGYPNVDNLIAIENPRVRIAPSGRKDCSSVLPNSSKLIKHLYMVDCMGVTMISNMLGWSTATIYNHLRKEGVKLRGKFNAKSKSHV